MCFNRCLISLSIAQAISDKDKVMEDVKPVVECFDVTMDLIGGMEKRSECCYYGDKTGEQQQNVGPELGLSLKRCCSGGSLEKKQDESKHQKLSLSDASAFSRFGVLACKTIKNVSNHWLVFCSITLLH